MQADSPTASGARRTTTSYTAPGTHDASAPPAPTITPAIAETSSKSGTSYITGAYMPSGNPMIDRMLELERALKHFGSPF